MGRIKYKIRNIREALRTIMQQINRLFNAKYATINFEMQRIKCIFVVKYATNGNFYISKR